MKNYIIILGAFFSLLPAIALADPLPGEEGPVIDTMIELKMELEAEPGVDYDPQTLIPYKTVSDFMIKSFALRLARQGRAADVDGIPYETSNLPKIELYNNTTLLETVPFLLRSHLHDNSYVGPKVLTVTFRKLSATTALEIRSASGVLKKRIELSSGTCNYNGVCNTGENRAVCAADCAVSALDSVCDAEKDGICDPDCAQYGFSGFYDLDCRTAQATLCTNGLWDLGEEFIDCGGACSTACTCDHDLIRRAARAVDAHQLTAPVVTGILSRICDASQLLHETPWSYIGGLPDE